jgi:hypothetical protein
MGWQDKRLLLPSILTVFTNFFFIAILALQAKKQFASQAGGMVNTLSSAPHQLLEHAKAGDMVSMVGGLNGPVDQSGFNAMGILNSLTSDTAILGACIVSVWWLTNRFLEGVTTALVYSHLTEGRGSGKFSTACQAVLASLPAIVILGLVTMIAKKVAGFMRNKRSTGVLGFGLNFLAGIVEVFWTLAGHLILPSIVIEGSSFWGALKRADKIAQGNLLTIGVGEVGVDAICRFVSWLVYLVGMAGLGLIWYARSQNIVLLSNSLIFGGGFAWACLVIAVTAMSLYIRAAFYTCLYVWAIEAESVEETQRHSVSAPAPLAHALA